jgi:DNA-binding NarL/FixJ family response regulator
MSTEQAKSLVLIPLNEAPVPSKIVQKESNETQAESPFSQTRLSPRALAQETPHQAVMRGSRLSQTSLLAGDWTVVDSTRNGSELRVLLRAGAATITTREHDVIQAVLHGETDRSISQRMGITRQCVCGHLGNGLEKMGLDSRFGALQTWRALAEIEKGRSGRAQIAEVKVGSETLLSIRCPIAPRPEMEVRLSNAETNVAWLISDGESNREIAFIRGTAERTVANQVASLFAKLDLSRRFDVAQFVLGLC